MIAGIEKLIGHKFLNADVYFIDYLPSQIQAQDVYMVCGGGRLVLSYLRHPVPGLACGPHPACRGATL
ncbi:LolC/E family lipoprotein releasing system, transmembrane protein [Pseudomonas putida S11]|nr:LolC/E family lipoprotein releasing system, transmembrane protein [Pseudomonas putida S11]